MGRPLKVLELFGGIGACSKALTNLGVEHEIVDLVEIDRFAVASFNAVHGTNFEPQDITKWDKDIEVDLIMHGSPCQDFSVAGRQAGGDEGSGTRSSLLYETVRIVSKLKPKYVIWENVKNLISQKHFHNFQNYLDKMTELGYESHYQVLNAKDYGIPQNRERVFIVSIREDLGQSYEFPQPIPLEKKLGDMLEDEVDEKYVLSEQMVEGMKRTNYASYKYEKLYKEKNDIADTLKARFDGCPQCVDVELPGAYGRDFGSKGKIEDKEGVAPTLQAAMGSGGGNVPLVVDEAQPIKRRRTEYEKQMRKQYENHEVEHSEDMRESYVADDGIMPTLTTARREQVIVEPMAAATHGRKASEDEPYEQKLEVNPSGVANTITSAQKDSLTIEPSVKPLVAKNIERESEQIMCSDKEFYTCECTENYADNKVGLKVSPSLRASNSSTYAKTPTNRVRKLTPKECWRLMGFSDEDFEKASKVNSNTQLYKQAGNSIVLNVLEGILKNLLCQ